MSLLPLLVLWQGAKQIAEFWRFWRVLASVSRDCRGDNCWVLYSSSGSSLLGHLDRLHSLIIHALLLLLCNHTYNSVLACFSLFLLLLVYIRSCFLLVVPVAGSLVLEIMV